MIYEVRCERCQTSFAPETRRCLHCGGRLKAGAALRSALPREMQPAGLPPGGVAPPAPGTDSQGQTVQTAQTAQTAQPELPPGVGDEEVEEEPPQRRIFWGAITGLLAMLGALLRDCF